MMEGIAFRADGFLFKAGYRDVTAFHGGRYPAGTALGYQALRLARSLLFSEGQCFSRGKESIETAFGGLGFRDTAEMVLRLGDRYRFDPDMAAGESAPAAPVRGKYFFRVSHGDGRVEMALKDGLVPDEFYKISEDLHFGRIPRDREGEAMKLRRELETALLAMEPGEIFDVPFHSPCSSLRDCADKPGDPEPPELRDDFTLRLTDWDEYDVVIGQLQRYHGDGSTCGLCLAWSLVRQWALDINAASLPRRKVEILSGAAGRGVDDAFEFLFRAFSDGRAAVDLAWGDGTPAPKVLPGAGAFAFRLSSPDAVAKTYILKEKFVPREYLRLCEMKREYGEAFKEERALKTLQREFARRMLAEAEAFAVYE